MEKSVCDMKASTYAKFLQRCDFAEIFVTSVARTNLEIEIVQRGGSFVKPKKPVAPSSTTSTSTSSSSAASSSAYLESLAVMVAKKSSCIREYIDSLSHF